MDRRGATSFAILFILNPIVILFYQNCSVLPSQAQEAQKASRSISSVQEKHLDQSPCRFVSSKQPCAE